jgi:hypothetical protein
METPDDVTSVPVSAHTRMFLAQFANALVMVHNGDLVVRAEAHGVAAALHPTDPAAQAVWIDGMKQAIHDHLALNHQGPVMFIPN